MLQKTDSKPRELINRDNYSDVMNYLSFCENVRQNDPKTLKRWWGCLRHLLEWAGARSFSKAATFRPAFPAYLVTARLDDKEDDLSPATMLKVCNCVRAFFEHMRTVHPGKYRAVSPEWINTIRPPRSHGMQSEIRDHAYYTIDDMIKISAAPVENMANERDRAAACLAFLSGMRADALVTLPLSCLDLKTGRVHQVPKYGVRTKNHKAAITTLLPIPELMDVVRAWDAKIRGKLPDSSAWFARINPGGDGFSHPRIPSEGRRELFSKGLRVLCNVAGVKYLSPHKLRHGHVVFALKNVKDMAGLKAVSQNVMHANVGITDGLYGVLVEDDVHNIISSISGIHDEPSSGAPSKEAGRLFGLLEKLADNPEMLERLLKML